MVSEAVSPHTVVPIYLDNTILIGIVLESIAFSVKLSLNHENFDTIFFMICPLLIPDLSYKYGNIFIFYFS